MPEDDPQTPQPPGGSDVGACSTLAASSRGPAKNYRTKHNKTIQTSNRPRARFHSCRYEMLCGICPVQIQPRKRALEYANYSGFHPDTSYRSYRSYRSGIYISALKDLDREMGIKDLYVRCVVPIRKCTTRPMPHTRIADRPQAKEPLDPFFLLIYSKKETILLLFPVVCPEKKPG